MQAWPSQVAPRNVIHKTHEQAAVMEYHYVYCAGNEWGRGQLCQYKCMLPANKSDRISAFVRTKSQVGFHKGEWIISLTQVLSKWSMVHFQWIHALYHQICTQFTTVS